MNATRARRRAWFTGIEGVQPGLCVRLRRLLEECKPLPVTGRLNSVLVVWLAAGGSTTGVFGVRADGSVEIPWEIRGPKEAFRPFAEAVAASIPGASAVETPKTWSVRKGRRHVSLTELLDASPAVCAALARLHAHLGERE